MEKLGQPLELIVVVESRRDAGGMHIVPAGS